ncbi:sensor domain-containing diguanylate cyclase [Acidithrix sp. C25]|uniref:sensor domain-containing diguanylate cyclase n=1 Tax=Acidithrix sp. C25 TaxID=1671482 RepID=UPI00191BBA75|nr:sensor domain-containing diguanylate cyclase [Acidithrix sp. C25]CAG4915404.1 unnamed protein product [Acidithrix sp. C25]
MLTSNRVPIEHLDRAITEFTFASKATFVIAITFNDANSIMGLVAKRASKTKNETITLELGSTDWMKSKEVIRHVKMALPSHKPRRVKMTTPLKEELSHFIPEILTLNDHSWQLIVPIYKSNLALILIDAKEWNTPSIAELSRLIPKDVTASFDPTSDEALDRLILELSSAAATADSWVTGLRSLCSCLAIHLGFSNSTLYALDQGRLVPVVACSNGEVVNFNSSYPTKKTLSALSSLSDRAFELRTPIDFDSNYIDAMHFKDSRSNADGSRHGIVVPLRRGESKLGVIVLEKPINSSWNNLVDSPSVTLLLAHLALLFTQFQEDQQKELRLRATDGLAPMLDAATQIITRDEMAKFLARSLSLTLGSESALFVLFENQSKISVIASFGCDENKTEQIRSNWIGVEASYLPFYRTIAASHEPLLIEYTDSSFYTNEIVDLVQQKPYAIVPISTSDGLIGFGASTISKDRKFWSSQEKSIALDWSISATLVADNVGLRLSEQRSLEKFREMAFKDSLTGLPNRELFNDRLGVALGKAQRTNARTAVIFIDIDLFKHINDTYGHQTGDQVLVQIARRLLGVFRDTDTVARLSGDEFVVLVENAPERDELIEIATRAFNRLNDLYSIGQLELNVSISMGIALGAAGISGLDLLANADKSMYRSKERGRARLSFHDNREQFGEIDLRETFEFSKRKIEDQATNKLRSDLVPTLYLRFSADYVEMAKLRHAIESLTGSPAPHSYDRRIPNDLQPTTFLASQIGDVRPELVAFRPGLDVANSNDGHHLSVLRKLTEMGPTSEIFSSSMTYRGAKVLVELGPISVQGVGDLAYSVANFARTFERHRRLVLSITSGELAKDPDLLTALSALAIRFRCELMISSVENRELRFHDICMPMVTYLAISANEAVSDANRAIPNSLSSLLAIAHDRGIRIVAQHLNDEHNVDPLVMAGVTVISGDVVSFATSRDPHPRHPFGNSISFGY